MALLPDRLHGKGWRAERRRNEPWFYWVFVDETVDMRDISQIPGVGYDGISKGWAMPEEVLAMTLAKETR